MNIEEERQGEGKHQRKVQEETGEKDKDEVAYAEIGKKTTRRRWKRRVPNIDT